MIYKYGEGGVQKNLEEAIQLFFEASKKNHPMAFEELKKIAKTNNAEALNDIGICYMIGACVEKKIRKRPYAIGKKARIKNSLGHTPTWA